MLMESIPKPTVSLSLTVRESAAALTFYSDAFGAQELFRMPSPDGGIAHAEFLLGNTRIYLSDESPEWQAFAMPPGAAASCLFAIATEDCDGAYKKAIAAGAESLSEPTDTFWGMRSALLKDPFGYRWALNQQIEEVSPEELEKRAKAMYSS
jgi:uncharacterized glyoxalase superfamily protein PhnB